MPPLNSGCCPNYYCRPLVFLQPFSSLSLFIHRLDLPKGALIPLRDPMSSVTNILEMGKSKLHGVMGDRGGAKGDRCVLALASPAPLLLQQHFRMGDGQVTLIINTAHHFPHPRLGERSH